MIMFYHPAWSSRKLRRFLFFFIIILKLHPLMSARMYLPSTKEKGKKKKKKKVCTAYCLSIRQYAVRSRTPTQQQSQKTRTLPQVHVLCLP